MADAVDKPALHAELVAQLGLALASAQRAHAAAVEGATHTEARAEGTGRLKPLPTSLVPSEEISPARKFIGGVPMNWATKRLLGVS